MRAQLVRRIAVVFAHAAIWVVSYGGAFLLRFEGEIPVAWRSSALEGLLVLVALRVATFWPYGLFHGIFRYAGIPEVRSIFKASTLASVLFVGVGVLVHTVQQPRSIYVGEWLLAILGASGARLVVRMFREHTNAGAPLRHTLLIGAGDAGEMFLRDLERIANPQLKVVGILDDDPEKQGRRIRGIRVLGPADEVTLHRWAPKLEARLAVLAMPTASGARTREILSSCVALGIEAKTLPSFQQILTGEVSVSMLRDIAIEDLLRREPIQLDERSMDHFLRGKRVLVTGGAGSIGSELARQALRYEPASLALLDHNENALFFLDRELTKTFPQLPLVEYVGDIKDARRVGEIMRSFRPHVVLHAAAHKHVPLMELNPAEAVKNNVFGTRTVADLANAYGVETFVLISTDKAVNPTSIMGATKRIAEMYLQAVSAAARTKFVTVRFGNVLGSAGSVVPIFRGQIAAGGPVTVTHPEMSRYFMTIPEAAQLVLQAGALANGGEIFLLDMGEPVKIVDLARDMIRMSGLSPETDIKIVFTGERPGEKLHEELLHAGEDSQRTVHPKILVGKIKAADKDFVEQSMLHLRDTLEDSNQTIARAISAIVPEATLEGLGRSEPRPDVEQVMRDLGALESLTARGA